MNHWSPGARLPSRAACRWSTRSSSSAPRTRSCGTREGRRYVDFAGGIAVLNTGHRHRRVLEAVRAQLDKVTHTCFQITPYEPYVALCEKLNALAPGKGPNKTVLMSTGRRGGRERGQDRARRDRPRRRHRLLGRLPRPHDHGARADRQGRSLQSRASAPTRPRSTTRRSRTRCTACRWTTHSARSRRSSSATSPPTASRPSSSSRCRAKAASTSRRRNSWCGCASSATGTESS